MNAGAGSDDRRSAAVALLCADAVRTRAGDILTAALDGRLDHFTIFPDRLAATADIVATVIRDSKPGLDVPLHSRWRHFTIAGRDLWQERAAVTPWPDAAARARAEFDLAVVSVLLDAGAGPQWRYRDRATGTVSGRSEGLALASFRLFEIGTFSAVTADPLRADAARLEATDSGLLATGFDVSDDNPLVGLDGRVALIRRLGAAVARDAAVFARQDMPRPGGLFDLLASQCEDGRLAAPRILEAVLAHFGAIWPGRLSLGGVPLGDTWRHDVVKRADSTTGFVPFHKLSQWLAYSLIEPLQTAGIRVTDVDGLTGLAEYRNGGLFVDAGVIQLRDRREAEQPQAIDSTLVVEWRGLTVALLDRLAPMVRKRLGVSAEAFPLARVLEGGTWRAGRQLAHLRRPDGSPPIRVISDGTVF